MNSVLHQLTDAARPSSLLTIATDDTLIARFTQNPEGKAMRVNRKQAIELAALDQSSLTKDLLEREPLLTPLADPAEVKATTVLSQPNLGDGESANGNESAWGGIIPDALNGKSLLASTLEPSYNFGIMSAIEYGSDNPDELQGTSGSDELYGLAGDDTYHVDHTGDLVVETTNNGTDLVLASLSYTLTSNVENLTLIGVGALNGTGNSLDNVLTGNSGINSLSGSDGSDYIDGGDGADQMTGGLGDDTFIVDSASDLVVESAGQGNDEVRTSVSYTLGLQVER